MRNILSVGVSPNILEGVKSRLTSPALGFIETQSAREAFEALRKNIVSLILLNNRLPDHANYREFCILLRSQERFTGMPIILLGEAEESAESKIQSLNTLLINDYIVFPPLIEEIVARVNIFMELRTLQEELEASNVMFKKAAITDELTRLYNRRHLFDRLAEELERMKRQHFDTTCVLMDLDFFKKINDQFGHQKGDQVLVELAQLIKANCRSIDISGRYGGEEFMVILPYTNLEQAMILAERLRHRVHMHKFAALDPEHKLTVSIGMVSFTDKDDLNVDAVVRTVDEQLYQAKGTGRNRVCAIKFSKTRG